MSISQRDLEILRQLGRRVAEVAALPDQQAAIGRWKALNGLKPVRPMVMIDQVCWNEMNVNDELSTQCEDGWCRGVEWWLKQLLYRWKHMRVDMVVEPFVNVHAAVGGFDFGVQIIETTAAIDPKSDVVGHHYEDQFKTEDDLVKIKTPKLVYDAKATAEMLERAHGVFDGILGVRLQGWTPGFAPWDVLAMWHSPGAILYDLADRPEFMHKLIARFTEATLAALDQAEALGVIGPQTDTIHCTGAWTDDLPAPGSDPHGVRAKNLWTFGMSQIFSAVSPAMHEEFERPYLGRWFGRFGLAYYGCCEPLDDRIDMVRKLPNVRKISMSPWVNQERGAEAIGSDFVFSRKPSPAFLAWDGWNPAAVEKDLRETTAACRRYGCPVELILKDISTVRYEPQRLWEWAEIAMRVAQE